jgi:hypothetical protein
MARGIEGVAHVGNHYLEGRAAGVGGYQYDGWWLALDPAQYAQVPQTQLGQLRVGHPIEEIEDRPPW